MVDLPSKKVGIIACSGEDIPEGTISRVATRKVLEELRPENSVTLCLPLFLAGDERERAFARFHPTIAVDGCEKLCAKKATEKYSGPVSGSIVVNELLRERGLSAGQSRRQLGETGQRAAQAVADAIVTQVEEILEARKAAAPEVQPLAGASVAAGATCGCDSGIPMTQVRIGGVYVGILALEGIFELFRQEGRQEGPGLEEEILQAVKLYNYVPAEAEQLYRTALLQEYERFCLSKGR